uniref:Slc39a-1 n=1 Tax=Schmidtea mediterranea TaxID=79327 RepID=A0A0H3YJE9_SCHMD|nr:slc39a-1 [Schmidtea mediterranea]
MGSMKRVASVLLLLNLGICCGNIHQSFSDILSLGQRFNLSNVDFLFDNFKIKTDYWKASFGKRNITEKCGPVISYLNKFSNSVVEINNEKGLKTFNNYILSRLLNNPCGALTTSKESQKFSVLQIWIYGLLTVTVNNVLAILGIFFIPLMKKKIYNSVMTFMVSLAIGALAGTSILILIPDSMQISEIALKAKHDKNDYKWKATGVVAGLYLFFLTERLLKSLTNQKTCSHATAHPVMKFEIMKLENSDRIQSRTQTENSLLQQMKLNDKDQEKGNDCDVKNSKAKEIIHLDKTKKGIAPVAWMVVFGDSLHNLVDGMSIGAGFSQSVILGVSISLAVLCEELPHELGDFAVLLTAGMSVKQAVFWNLMSAMTCYLGFIIGVIVGDITSASVWIFAFAGGMFLYISLVDMMNNIIETIDDMIASWKHKALTFALQNLGLFTGYATILVLSLYSDKIRFDI